jgi:hypothetical protein
MQDINASHHSNLLSNRPKTSASVSSQQQLAQVNEMPTSNNTASQPKFKSGLLQSNSGKNSKKQISGASSYEGSEIRKKK